MKIQTNRLTLRDLLDKDLDNIHELLSLPETDQYNTLGIPENVETTKNILTEWLITQRQNPRNSYILYIETTNTQKFIGLIALNIGKPKYKTAEVWYKIHKDNWNNGYATESLIRLVRYGFHNLNLHRIEAGCAVENIASKKVLEKAGMVREGIKRKKMPVKGHWVDNYFYAILEDDLPELNAEVID